MQFNFSLIQYEHGDIDLPDFISNLLYKKHNNPPTQLFQSLIFTSKKVLFARDRATRGYILLYHLSCIDPLYQSHTFGPHQKVPFWKVILPS